MIDLLQVVAELDLGCFHELFGLIDLPLDFLYFTADCRKMRDIEALTHERVTNLHDLIS